LSGVERSVKGSRKNRHLFTGFPLGEAMLQADEAAVHNEDAAESIGREASSELQCEVPSPRLPHNPRLCPGGSVPLSKGGKQTFKVLDNCCLAVVSFAGAVAFSVSTDIHGAAGKATAR
jgi:hypothetical protein